MGRVLLPFEYHEPATAEEAMNLAAEHSGTFLMGGCTLVPALRRRERRDGCLVSLARVEGLDQFNAHPKTGLTVGAKVRAAALSPDIWTGKRFAALHEAVEQLYPPHIANMGSLVGNLCSAVPYFDLPTAAIALDAQMHITGPDGDHVVALEDFYTAEFKTVLKSNEIVTHVFCPPPNPDSGSGFKKIYRSRRTKQDLHKINAAASVSLDPERDKIVDARVVLGSWDFRPHRYRKAEEVLAGQAPSFELFTTAADAVMAELSPVTDMDWVEKTRFAQARVLLRDTIAQAASRAKSRHDPFEDAAEILEGAK